MQVLDTAVHAGPENVVVDFLGEAVKIAVTMILPDPQLAPDDAALLGQHSAIEHFVEARRAKSAVT